MIADRIEALAAVLAVEERLYVELRDLLQREHALMVTLEAEGLEEVALQKEALVDEGRLIEDSRLVVTRELAQEIGLPDPKPRLSTLCELLGPEARALRDAHTRLVVLLGVVRELMDANRAFAGDALSQVRGTLQMLGGLMPCETTYEPGASSEPHLGVGQLVRRTA